MQADGSGQQLLTPPLDGTILPGVTRGSILALARAWGACEVKEGNLTIRRLKQARGPCPGLCIAHDLLAHAVPTPHALLPPKELVSVACASACSMTRASACSMTCASACNMVRTFACKIPLKQ